ncbi:MAG: glycosyltransferase family 4 protein [Burkholderiales bacterium]|nr:glycosyltransferase family 4 protein [Burkholderiales bacterium]
MPRLLSLNTYHYRRGGSDAVFLEHEALFRNLGWETAMFSMHHPQNAPSPWEQYFVSEIEFGRTYRWRDRLVMAAKIVYSLEARRKMASLLRRFKPDVAHVHCIYHHISPSVFSLLKERNIPIVLTAHDFKLLCPAYKMHNQRGICERCRSSKILPLVVNRCVKDSLALSSLIAVETFVHRTCGLYSRHLDKIVVPSRFYLRKFQEWGWRASDLEYVPNFIQAADYIPQFEPGGYFVYFGRLIREKGVRTLLKAARMANCKLVLVGVGPDAASLHAAIEGNPNVHIVDHRTGDALSTLVRGSRAVVLPSELYENAPKSILEAYALGKPVIGADIGGIPELIRVFQTGALFESGNADDLAARLLEYTHMHDAAVANQGRCARQFVVESFSEERYAHEMLRLYGSLGVAVKPVLDAEDGDRPN